MQVEFGIDKPWFIHTSTISIGKFLFRRVCFHAHRLCRLTVHSIERYFPSSYHAEVIYSVCSNFLLWEKAVGVCWVSLFIVYYFCDSLLSSGSVCVGPSTPASLKVLSRLYLLSLWWETGLCFSFLLIRRFSRFVLWNAILRVCDTLFQCVLAYFLGWAFFWGNVAVFLVSNFPFSCFLSVSVLLFSQSFELKFKFLGRGFFFFFPLLPPWTYSWRLGASTACFRLIVGLILKWCMKCKAFIFLDNFFYIAKFDLWSFLFSSLVSFSCFFTVPLVL